MRPSPRLQVEVYAHGGWWKDDLGRTGQIVQALSSKGPLVTVAALTNAFGIDGWQLTTLVSAHHNTYIATFERAAELAKTEDDSESAPVTSTGGASINLG